MKSFYQYLESSEADPYYVVRLSGNRSDSYDFTEDLWADVRMIVEAFVYDYLRARGLFAGNLINDKEVRALAKMLGDKKKNRHIHPMSHHVPQECLKLPFEGQPVEVEMPPRLSGQKFVGISVVFSVYFVGKKEAKIEGLPPNSNYILFDRALFYRYAKKYLGAILDPIGVDTNPYIYDMIRGMDCVLSKLLANYDAKKRNYQGKRGMIMYQMQADDEDISDMRLIRMPADFSDVLDNIRDADSVPHQLWLLSNRELPEFLEAVRVGMSTHIKDRLLYNKLYKMIDYAIKHGMTMNIRGTPL